MGITKYPVSWEFFPFNLFKPPLSPRFVALAQKWMKTPSFVWKDRTVKAQSLRVPGYAGGAIEVILLTPAGLAEPAPCLVHIHGGGFVFEGYSSHYRQAMLYAAQVRCKVAYVRYRLAPAQTFPVQQEDCYQALVWLHAHAAELGIDPGRIGVCGDSAGGTLTVTSCMMARDRGATVKPLFQLLVYPWLDARGNSESCRRFTDTPMWNSTLSKKVGPMMNPDPTATPLAYRSPAEAKSFAGLPPAYIEVAEFDCLHDDGVLYASLLHEAGVSAELHEARRAMHGYDTVMHAPTTKEMLRRRVAFMRRMFGT